MAFRALLFDLDGTLWDSHPWYASLADDQERFLESLRQGRPVATLFRRVGITPARFGRLCHDNISSLVTYPGVRETLEAASAKGVPLGVATNLPRWIAVPMLECTGVMGYFSTVVDYGRTYRRKPYPDPLLAALVDMNLAAGTDIWYVGDSPQDLRAAMSAGLSFAWAAYGYYGESLSGCHAVLARFQDVLVL